jgi:acetyl-CoA carboxylase biotin carboxyl carrier protein
MDFDDIKQILTLVREHELAEFELERDGLKVRIKKGPSGHVVVQPAAAAAPIMAAVPVPVPAPAAAAVSSTEAAEGSEAAEDGSLELAVVKSPIVGTFYLAPEPGAPPFVEVGARVRKGQVLCIIEAMKLMNEIESEYEGEIVKIYVENGHPVQYGERLFAVKLG